MAIVHAETTEDCFNRMLTIMLMTGIQIETVEIQRMLAKAIDLIVHVELFADGVRRVTTISDVYFDNENNKVIVKDVFQYKQTGISEKGEILGEWVLDKTPPRCMLKFKKYRVKLPEGFFNEK